MFLVPLHKKVFCTPTKKLLAPPNHKKASCTPNHKKSFSNKKFCTPKLFISQKLLRSRKTVHIAFFKIGKLSPKKLCIPKKVAPSNLPCKHPWSSKITWPPDQFFEVPSILRFFSPSCVTLCHQTNREFDRQTIPSRHQILFRTTGSCISKEIARKEKLKTWRTQEICTLRFVVLAIVGLPTKLPGGRWEREMRWPLNLLANGRQWVCVEPSTAEQSVEPINRSNSCVDIIIVNNTQNTGSKDSQTHKVRLNSRTQEHGVSPLALNSN